MEREQEVLGKRGAETSWRGGLRQAARDIAGARSWLAEGVDTFWGERKKGESVTSPKLVKFCNVNCYTKLMKVASLSK